ncbi:MAG: toprim domain-containing protein [Nitrososphaerales archaeon]
MRDNLIREELNTFIKKLNDESIDSQAIVIVEGKRDVEALKALGYKGSLMEYYKGINLDNLINSLKKYKKVILLFDLDKHGRLLTAKLTRALESYIKVDLFYRRKLVEIAKGRFTTIQNLSKYS